MATAAFAILQISWTQTLVKARQRIIGVAGGAALMALALWVLPPQLLLPLSLLAALTGLWLIAGNQVLSIGSFVVVSVGMNVVGGCLDPTRTLLEYVLLLFAGVAVGLLIGFVVVPHLTPDRVDAQVGDATQAAADLLRCTARAVPTDAAKPHRVAVSQMLLKPLSRLRTSVANLRSPLNPKDEQAGVLAADGASLAVQFETLAFVGILETGAGRLTARTLEDAADVLDGASDDTPSRAVAPADDAEFVQLARWVGNNSRELQAAHRQGPPSRS